MDIRKKVLLKLIHQPEARFSELWDKDIESNTFTYHLKRLEEEGMVEKHNDLYRLTDKGKQQSAFIEGETGDKAAMPTPTVIVVVLHEGKVLAQRRLKEPFYGYYGFISGKINFGYNVLECAKRDLKEETGLEADLTFKGFAMAKTYNNGELAYHHYVHYILAQNPRGTLVAKTHKGEHRWCPLDNVDTLTSFPDFPHVIEWVQSDHFFIREFERQQQDHKFVSMNVTSARFL